MSAKLQALHPKPPTRRETAATQEQIEEIIRDRVVELKRVSPDEIRDHEGNWRTHSLMQKDVMRGVLKEVGVADTLLGYYSPRNGNKLTLIDGHLRKGMEMVKSWPVVILDVDDAEADYILSTKDPIAALAGANAAAVQELHHNIEVNDLAVREMLRQIEMQAVAQEEELEEAMNAEPDDLTGPPEMELQPFEHYSYLVLLFKTSFDFERALDQLAIRREGFTIRTNKNWEGGKRKIGIGRLLDGKRVINMISGPAPESLDGKKFDDQTQR
jgi:hypothetical protein